MKMDSIGTLPRLHRLLDAAQEMPSIQASVAEKNKTLVMLVQEAASILHDVTPCKKGCSHCCYQAVGIATYEAAAIGKYIGVTPVTLTQKFENPSVMQERNKGVACVFLKEGKCSIYEVRPLACRTHYNLSEYPELCDIANINGTVPNMNFSAVWNAQVAINMGTSVFDDIRQFFPNGSDNIID